MDVKSYKAKTPIKNGNTEILAYIKFELDHPNRWRSAAEIKDYLAWVITQVDLLEKELPCSPAKISK